MGNLILFALRSEFSVTLSREAYLLPFLFFIIFEVLSLMTSFYIMTDEKAALFSTHYI